MEQRCNMIVQLAMNLFIHFRIFHMNGLLSSSVTVPNLYEMLVKPVLSKRRLRQKCDPIIVVISLASFKIRHMLL
jgi:hypothetical protein